MGDGLNVPSPVSRVAVCMGTVNEAPAGIPYPLSWYAVRVRTNAEKSVSVALRAKGYEEYLPLYQHNSRWTDRFKILERPLFPGYVFCRLDPTFRRPLLTVPGVNGIVGFGRAFAPIEDSEIEAVRRVVLAGLPAMRGPFLASGQRVRIRSGPLDGVEGVLTRIKNTLCVVVSITILQRSVAVEVDRDCLEPLPGPYPRVAQLTSPLGLYK
jgi:transcription antitermination factor NusG